MVRALLIEFDARTGKRAGDINPRDPALPCHGWQNLESDPALEIRLIEDDRDLSQYNGIPGVTLLEGVDKINQTIDEVVPDRFNVVDEALMLEHIRQEGISLRDYAGKDRNFIIKDFYGRGIVGIICRKPEKVK